MASEPVQGTVNTIHCLWFWLNRKRFQQFCPSLHCRFNYETEDLIEHCICSILLPTAIPRAICKPLQGLGICTYQIACLQTVPGKVLVDLEGALCFAACKVKNRSIKNRSTYFALVLLNLQRSTLAKSCLGPLTRQVHYLK